MFGPWLFGLGRLFPGPGRQATYVLLCCCAVLLFFFLCFFFVFCRSVPDLREKRHAIPRGWYMDTWGLVYGYPGSGMPMLVWGKRPHTKGLVYGYLGSGMGIPGVWYGVANIACAILGYRTCDFGISQVRYRLFL